MTIADIIQSTGIFLAIWLISTTAHYHDTITVGPQKGYTCESIPVASVYDALEAI